MSSMGSCDIKAISDFCYTVRQLLHPNEKWLVDIIYSQRLQNGGYESLMSFVMIILTPLLMLSVDICLSKFIFLVYFRIVIQSNKLTSKLNLTLKKKPIDPTMNPLLKGAQSFVSSTIDPPLSQ